MSKLSAKTTGLLFGICIVLICFCACGTEKGKVNEGSSGSDSSSSVMKGDIDVISREDGSGTRSAFAELLKILDLSGNDAIFAGAEITNSTGVMLGSVSRDKQAIGYASIGCLSDDVKTLKINGVQANAENVKNGKYLISRPFIIAYRDSSETYIIKDFISFITSSQGQDIITKKGYIGTFENATSYTPSQLDGIISIEGSTSVGPVMELLAEEYMKLNKEATVTVTQDGSGTGIASAIDGGCNICMSSRSLTSKELKELTPVKIALDGIAVIVNKDNAIDDLSDEMLRDIFMGNTTKWELLN